MGALALVGALTLVLAQATQRRLLVPLVAFAAGSMLGGALFHLLPEGVAQLGNVPAVYAWAAGGFAVFFVLELFLHRHHGHRPSEGSVAPVTVLVLIADSLHNFLDGMAVAGGFLVDTRVGIATLLAAASHEVPQELGDFGILVHGGWGKTRALAFNVLSGLVFLVGGLLVYALAGRVNTGFLLPFAAGGFVYIAAADLIPEIVRHPGIGASVVHGVAFFAGLLLLGALRLVLGA